MVLWMVWLAESVFSQHTFPFFTPKESIICTSSPTPRFWTVSMTEGIALLSLLQSPFLRTLISSYPVRKASIASCAKHQVNKSGIKYLEANANYIVQQASVRGYFKLHLFDSYDSLSSEREIRRGK